MHYSCFRAKPIHALNKLLSDQPSSSSLTADLSSVNIPASFTEVWGSSLSRCGFLLAMRHLLYQFGISGWWRERRAEDSLELST